MSPDKRVKTPGKMIQDAALKWGGILSPLSLTLESENTFY